MALRVVHFADAHIDILSSGKRNAEKGLSIRVMDFLAALDQIVDTAITEKADLVLFAGDAYRDHTPQPTFQREWGMRMMRLSKAKIPTVLIPGNHDVTAAAGKASALQEYDTLDIPFIHLARRIKLWTPDELDGVPVQILTLPWISRSRLEEQIHSNELEIRNPSVFFESELSKTVDTLLKTADPSLPVILLAHYSVIGASYPNQQMVTLGQEITLSEKLTRDPRISYTALGHIHQYQDLNKSAQPPVVYPGSIERVNFGEIREPKGFIVAHIENHHAAYSFREIKGRPYISKEITIDSPETFQTQALEALPSESEIQGAMIRLILNYPREWENFLDERELYRMTNSALSFQLVKKPISRARIRIDQDQAISSLSALDLLEKYCETKELEPQQQVALQKTAADIFNQVNIIEAADFSGS